MKPNDTICELLEDSPGRTAWWAADWGATLICDGTDRTNKLVIGQATQMGTFTHNCICELREQLS